METTISKKLRSDLLISILIVIVPFLSFTYLFFDSQSNVLSAFGFVVNHQYKSNSLMIWHLMNSAAPLMLLILFYSNINSNWRYFLLIPISIETISTIFVFHSNINYNEFLFSFYGLALVLLSTLITIGLDRIYLKKFFKIRLVINAKKLLKLISIRRINQYNRKAQEVLGLREKLSKKRYSYHLYHMKDLMYSRIQFAKNAVEIKSIENQKANANSNYYAFTLLLLSFSLISHLLLPKGIENIDVFGIEVSNFGFKSFRSFLWYFNRKFIYILLLFIWLLKCTHWWKWTIFSPIALYSLQLLDIFSDQTFLEEESNFILLPIILISLLFLFSLGSSLVKIQKMISLKGSLDKEFNEIIEELSRNENFKLT